MNRNVIEKEFPELNRTELEQLFLLAYRQPSMISHKFFLLNFNLLKSDDEGRSGTDFQPRKSHLSSQFKCTLSLCPVCTLIWCFEFSLN